MSEKTPQKSVLITGVSSGIGGALAAWYLEQGWRALGLSRRTPDDLIARQRFEFARVDLADAENIAAPLIDSLAGRRHWDLLILNAGVLGQFGDLRDATLADLHHTMQVNVWANKIILDALFEAGVAVDQVVAISSGASINGNRGWSGYSISKAALNMLILLYARERPQTHLCALAPGLVDTGILAELRALPADTRFPSLANIEAKRNTPEMPTPAAAAPQLATAIARLPTLVSSGAYADLRALPGDRPQATT